MGVRLSHWVTMHGFALNVRPDMSYFDGMIPCGIQGKGVISMAEILTEAPQVTDVIPVLVRHFQDVFGFDQIVE
jgi:lipoate-protein ligase B